MTDICYIKAQLSEICEERFRGALVRARTEKYIFGEQPTRRALAGEKKYALSIEINAIESGPLLTTDKAAIEAAFVRHYRSLFSSTDSSSCPDKLNCLLAQFPQLSEAAGY